MRIGGKNEDAAAPPMIPRISLRERPLPKRFFILIPSF
jgi:hypothetical protein